MIILALPSAVLCKKKGRRKKRANLETKTWLLQKHCSLQSLSELRRRLEGDSKGMAGKFLLFQLPQEEYIPGVRVWGRLSCVTTRKTCIRMKVNSRHRVLGSRNVSGWWGQFQAANLRAYHCHVMSNEAGRH